MPSTARWPKKDAKGNPVFGFADFTFEVQDDIVIMRLGYMANDVAVGHCPALALTAVELAKFAGACQRQVIEMKQRENVVTSFRRQ